MDRNRILVSLLTLFVVLTIGSFGSAIYFYNEKETLRSQLDDMEATPVKAAVESTPRVVVESSSRPEDSRDVEALNAYIDKLEKEKAALAAQVERGSQDNGRGRRNRGQRMNLEQLKESNPEEYKRIMSFREEMQKRMDERSSKRKAYFAALDTSRMNSEQKSTLEDYQTLLEEMDNARNNPNGDRREMFQMMRDANEMRTSVQAILLEQLGNKLGTDGSSLATGVNEILDITGGMGPGGMGPGGGMPPGGGMGGSRGQ